MAQVGKAFNPGSAVAIGGTAVAAVAANPNRNKLFLQNDHATQVIYLSLGGTAALNAGLRLLPVGANIVEIDFYEGAVSAIATGATTPLLITEF